ncbi:hypothetical protein [Paenibacillus koleovorans]|uniref:hypothetical protein n=1 Tax=Paenibacillus koleovorans TaxID=121608 RepID=UPI0013E2F267|nr:hypothetical protein [Paenibacillus koleovorans]
MVLMLGQAEARDLVQVMMAQMLVLKQEYALDLAQLQVMMSMSGPRAFSLAG